MPKPEEKKKEEQVIVEDDLDNKDSQKENDGIEIPLDDNGEALSPETKKKEQEELKKSQEEETHRRNAEFAQRRIDQEKAKLRQQLEESNRRIAELEKKTTQPLGFANNANVQKDKAYWEKRLADDPVGALDEYEDFKYQQRLQKQIEQQERQQMVDSFQATLEDSKNMAIEEFPSLNDENSPEFSMFMEILDKNPAWRNSPIGPMKVVREMKKLMADGKGGEDIISTVKAQAETNERNRQRRIINQPLSNNRPMPQSNKIVLTKEQMDVWQSEFKDRGMSLEKYASMVNRTQRGGEVII